MDIILKGWRINLRRIHKADAESIVQHANAKEISRFTFIPHPYGIGDALTFIRRSQSAWRSGSMQNFGIENRETGKIIGMVGIIRISKKHRQAEIGYWLGKKFWGKGIATEAVLLILEYCFKNLKLHRVCARVMHPNLASAKLLEALGFKKAGGLRDDLKQRGRWMDTILYGLLRQEYKLPAKKIRIENPI